MWASSADFQAQLHASSRRWATRIDVLFGPEIVTSLNVLVSGYVSLDSVAVRREAHFTIVDADGTLTPALATDLLAPKGTELRLYRGLFLPTTGAYEWVPLGVFGIVEPKVHANDAGTQIDVKGFDRIDKLRSLDFEDPYVVVDGALIHVTMAAIVAQQMPGVALRVTPSTYTTPAVTFDRLTSPWDALRTLMDASTYVCYFDPLGTCVIEPYTEYPSGITYAAGQPDSLLMEADASWDSSITYSGVIARGEHPDKTPIRVEVWDTNPASPTYSLGPFGRRPYGYYSQLAIDTGQLTDIANQLFALHTKMHQQVEIFTRGGPGHEIGDVIRVDDYRTKIHGYYAVVSATIPIVNVQGDHMRLLCREAM